MDKSVIKESWRKHLHEVIFEADTPAGKGFDIALLIAILLSILIVVLESVNELRADYLGLMRTLEWTFTILFTIEYILRIISAGKPWRYIFSFYGLVDFFSILPTYLSLILTGSQYLLVVRGLRLLRIFRILKLSRYLGEAEVLKKALYASAAKITVFLGAVFALTLIIGSVMYLIEGPTNGFTSIPKSIYWAIVTLTTVGYGDIAPQTTVGQTLAAAVMIMGYGIIAVPTGIVSVELSRAEGDYKDNNGVRRCPSCHAAGHKERAKYCYNCGSPLSE
ncbi:ion transporter [Roseivirga sp. BDSF3-8]|uniref:ion transporter n=1 Tax=Roseivirga sp. BDSF3-8 TaxID=3241598 RepID=UPI003531E55C